MSCPSRETQCAIGSPAAAGLGPRVRDPRPARGFGIGAEGGRRSFGLGEPEAPGSRTFLTWCSHSPEGDFFWACSAIVSSRARAVLRSLRPVHRPGGRDELGPASPLGLFERGPCPGAGAAAPGSAPPCRRPRPAIWIRAWSASLPRRSTSPSARPLRPRAGQLRRACRASWPRRPAPRAGARSSPPVSSLRGRGWAGRSPSASGRAVDGRGSVGVKSPASRKTGWSAEGRTQSARAAYRSSGFRSLTVARSVPAWRAKERLADRGVRGAPVGLRAGVGVRPRRPGPADPRRRASRASAPSRTTLRTWTDGQLLVVIEAELAGVARVEGALEDRLAVELERGHVALRSRASACSSRSA